MNGFVAQTASDPADAGSTTAVLPQPGDVVVDGLQRCGTAARSCPTADVAGAATDRSTINILTGNLAVGELLAGKVGGVHRVDLDEQSWINGALPPDLVLVDGSLDPLHPSTCRAVKRCRVQRLTVLVFGCSHEHLAAARWVDLGVDGLCYVDDSLATLERTISQLLSGETVLGVSVRETLLSKLRADRATDRDRQVVFENLTKREMEVLQLLAQASTPEEIARLSFVSLNTVRTQIRSILAKLSTSSVVGAVALAYSSGWMGSFGAKAD